MLAVARANTAGFQLMWRHAAREAHFVRYAEQWRTQAVAATHAALADRVPHENRDWAAHAVFGYMVEAVLNWLEFGDAAHDQQFVRATNSALRAGVRAWSEASGGAG
jgi:hypothetical protein